MFYWLWRVLLWCSGSGCFTVCGVFFCGAVAQYVFAHLEDHFAIKRYASKVSARRARLEASVSSFDGRRSRVRRSGR